MRIINLDQRSRQYESEDRFDSQAEVAKETFKALAPQYATIHLATHGVLDNRDPLNSYLLLTKTDGDPENDGSLQAREIINMRLMQTWLSFPHAKPAMAGSAQVRV